MRINPMWWVVLVLILVSTFNSCIGKARAEEAPYKGYLPIVSDPRTPEATSVPPDETKLPPPPVETKSTPPVDPTSTPTPSATPTFTPSPTATSAVPMAECKLPMDVGITYTTARPSIVVNSAIPKEALPASVPVTDNRVDPPTIVQILDWRSGPGRWEGLINIFSDPGRIGPFSTNCHLKALPGHWDVDTATNSLVKVQPTPTATPTKVPGQFTVRSIDTMNQTKDRLCAQPSDAFVAEWVRLAKVAGATHITIDTPYDSPSCANALDYAKRWATAIRAAGLKIWWRQMFLEFEAIYNAELIPQCNGVNGKNCIDYVVKTRQFLSAHPELYQNGDIFSVTAEPAASRIRGVNCFVTSCIFESATGSWNAIPEFNKFLRDSVTTARAAFSELGLDVSVNAGGLDGFVAIGYDNPDWGCDSPGKPHILYPETAIEIGSIVFDHYTDDMVGFLAAVEACYPVGQYPNLQFLIGEWGPTFGPNTPSQIAKAFNDVRVSGARFIHAFNYWQGGPSGQEALFTNSGSSIGTTANYAALKAEFTK